MSLKSDMAIYQTLTASTVAGSVHDLTNGRISASYADPGEDFPLVVFEQTGSEAIEVFGHTQLMLNETYEIRAVGRYEEGITKIADIGAAIVTAMHGTTLSVKNLDITIDVSSGTEVSRADELFIGTVQVSTKHMQISEL